MSDEPSSSSSAAGDSTTPQNNPSSSSSSNPQAIASALQSLSTILPSLSSSSSSNPTSLLHDQTTCTQITSLLNQPSSGAGDNPLCRWLYDTFQSSNPSLQLLVLRFLPTLAGLYLSRVPLRIPLAGFEAVLLALYAHETAARDGHTVTVNVPDLSHSSVYHEAATAAVKSNVTGLNVAVISSTLEPHGTIRSTRRARIVGVTLELYHSKINEMPMESKMEFCDFCKVWAGCAPPSEEEGVVARRVPLPCELMQPILRILGHCLLCPNQNKKLVDKAGEACASLYARAMHDVDPMAILALGSLIRLTANNDIKDEGFDPTEPPKSTVISI